MLEGIAAVAISFLLFTVLAQATVVFLAQRTAEAVVAAGARRAALGGGYSDQDLLRELRVVVPGARDVDGGLHRGHTLVVASAEIAMLPPGPVFGEVVLRVDASAPLVVAP